MTFPTPEEAPQLRELHRLRRGGVEPPLDAPAAAGPALPQQFTGPFPCAPGATPASTRSTPGNSLLRAFLTATDGTHVYLALQRRRRDGTLQFHGLRPASAVGVNTRPGDGVLLRQVRQPVIHGALAPGARAIAIAVMLSVSQLLVL